jgi:hypothetical protein
VTQAGVSLSRGQELVGTCADEHSHERRLVRWSGLPASFAPHADIASDTANIMLRCIWLTEERRPEQPARRLVSGPAPHNQLGGIQGCVHHARDGWRAMCRCYGCDLR